MSFDQGVAQRVREEITQLPEVEEKKMFGGVGFMLSGNMACGVINEDLIVRVGADNYQNALAAPHTREFDMTGRPMTGWVVVRPDGYRRDEDLRGWVERGVTFASSLPAK